MRLEQVLPHLRVGGKVKINGIETDLHRLQERNLGRLLSREDFEIVEELFEVDLSTLRVGDSIVIDGLRSWEILVVGVKLGGGDTIWVNSQIPGENDESMDIRILNRHYPYRHYNIYGKHIPYDGILPRGKYHDIIKIIKKGE
jgi:hypothetical protein